MATCRQCCETEATTKVQDPMSGCFFLGGVLVHPFEVCQPCANEINQDARDEIDERADEGDF